MTTDNAAVATVETFDEAAKDQSSLVRLWLDAISISSTDEEHWRKTAQNATDLYRQSGSADSHSSNKKFNILHANIETLCPALYNSIPIPDVRRRFNDSDPIAKTVADIQERCLQYSIESYDFDHVMKLAVKDSELTGRSVDRVRYKPYVGKDDKLAYQEVGCEHVEWKHFRRGPGHQWDDVPWIAFELFLTREELEKLSPKLGSKVTLDVSVNKPDDKGQDRDVAEIFKRARVWEIWDKSNRKVIFIAESYKVGPIREEDDPLELEGFFPIPRPLYAVTTSNSLVPVVPYEIYKAQADELEIVSARILVLTEAVKARALYDARITEMDRLEKADETDNVPIENVGIFADGSKLADHVMFYPIEVITAALEKLYLARDQIKQTIYEITGIADIMRGQSDPNETLGAQEKKIQWGSLRIQNKQAEIQRYARDIFRIKAEIFATKFEPQYLEMMAGIPLMPKPDDQPQVQQQKAAVIQMLRSDKLRGFRVDVESDSTIRADMTRNQQNMSQFLQGTAQFAQAMGPIVMTFKEMTPAVIDVYSAFARNFKLGKQAEDALDKVGQMALQMAQQPEKPDPQLQMEKEKLAAEQQAKAAEMQMKQQESQAKLMADQQANEQKLQFEAQKHAQEMQFEREKHQNEMAMQGQQMQMQAHQHEQQMAMDQQKNAVEAEGKAEERHLNHQAKLADTEAKSRPVVQLDANEAVKSIAPGVTEAMQKPMAAAVETMAKASQTMVAIASSIERAAKVMAADSEIVRDKSGRALRSRKVLEAIN